MKAKKQWKKYKELWSKIRDLIRSIIKNSDNYDEKYIKIKFNSDNELPLNKLIEILSMIIVVRVVFHENTKYYPQVFLDECLYKLWIIVIYDLLMMFMNLSDIAILKIKNADYCCIISGISKIEAIKLLIWLKKMEHYKN